MWFIAIIIMLSAVSCNKDNGPETPPMSKGEETVQNIALALDSKPEVSQFVEILKKVELPDVNEDRLTVFAVRNSLVSTRAVVLDSVSVKRHIAVGGYSRDALTDGLVLKSANGENLYISHAGNDILVNGVKIESDEIAVENSYVYIVPEVFEEQTSPTIPDEPESIDGIRNSWNSLMTTYAEKSWTVEASLTTSYNGFSFNDIKTLSDDYWTLSHTTIEEGEKFLSKIGNEENGRGLADTICVDIALIREQLYGYYGVSVSNDHVYRFEEFEQECKELIEKLPSACSYAVSFLLAKASLCNKQYDKAKELCERVMNSGLYQLPENAYSVDVKESLWRGFNDVAVTGNGGKSVMYPVIYREVYFVKGLSGYAAGNDYELIETLNIINIALGEPEISAVEQANIDLFLMYIRGTGGMYSYYKILTDMNKSIKFNYPYTEGFESPKHLLLPIPESAMSKYPDLEQNPNY